MKVQESTETGSGVPKLTEALTARVRRWFQESFSLVDTGLLLLVIFTNLSYELLNGRHGNLHVLRTALDRHIPLEPWFAVPYVLFLPVFWAVVVWAYLSQKRFRELALILIAVYVVSDLVFAFYQTYVSRPHVTGSGLGDQLLRFVYRHDHPFNGFPSEHSSSAAVIALYAVLVRLRYRALFVIFSAVVVASTLLIRQHFVLDAVGGISLALAVSAGVLLFGSRRDARVSVSD